MEDVLQVKDLNVHLKNKNNTFKILNDVNFSMKKNRILGVVGESGCGKSITCYSIMGLLSEEFNLSGDIYYRNKNILNMKNEQRRMMKGKDISIIMQNPMAAFDPICTIGNHFIETLQTHIKINKKDAIEKALDWLNLMKLPNPSSIMSSYPFELSGGMLQRVMIAIALSMNPQILIADEPTTALDVTIQYEILSHIHFLKEKYETSILLVSHDLGVIAQLADEVIVMYCGYIVEKASILTLFDNPLHPYTKALMNARPGFKKKRLEPIKGTITSNMNLNKTCPFFERCSRATSQCKEYNLELREVEKNHFVRCIKPI